MEKLQIMDLSKILDRYSDEWVAISEDERKVVGSGKKLKEALEEAKKHGVNSPIVTKVPKKYGSYVL